MSNIELLCTFHAQGSLNIFLKGGYKFFCHQLLVVNFLTTQTIFGQIKAQIYFFLNNAQFKLPPNLVPFQVTTTSNHNDHEYGGSEPHTQAVTSSCTGAPPSSDIVTTFAGFLILQLPLSNKGMCNPLFSKLQLLHIVLVLGNIQSHYYSNLLDISTLCNKLDKKKRKLEVPMKKFSKVEIFAIIILWFGHITYFNFYNIYIIHAVKKFIDKPPRQYGAYI